MKQLSRLYKIVFILITIVFGLNACSSRGKPGLTQITSGSSSTDILSAETPEVLPPQESTGENTNEQVDISVSTEPPSSSSTLVASGESNTPTPVGSPTPDLRLPPEDWQNWPVVPMISGTAVDIYQRGIAMGNDPQAFSKVGDCQAIKEVLMGIYDLPGRYFLTEDDQYLQDAIDYFAGSFNRDGYAVKGGFNAAAVLSPIWADPDACLPGETPLECEFRVHNPSIVIISLEVWWEGRTVERYEAYMRKIIEKAIEEGIVPVLSTKADNVEGDNSINAATARLAYEYDIPLWNFWLSVQDLPNHGIDPDRDGFHISTQAWDVRSYTALKVLDAVWKAGQQKDQQVLPTETAIPATSTPVGTNEETFTPIDLSNETLSSANQSGSIFFGVADREDENISYKGVFWLDLDHQKFSQIAGSGYNYQSASVDGQYLLINKGSELTLFNRQDKHEKVISNSFYSPDKQGSVWNANGSEFFYISQSVTGSQIHQYSLDNQNDQVVPVANGNPIRLYPSESSSFIIWEDGVCQEDGVCEENGVWLTALPGFETHFLGNFTQLAVGQGSPVYAYQVSPSDTLMVSINSLEQGLMREMQLAGDNFIDMQWSPVENKVAVLTLVRSSYSGKPSAVRIFVIDTTSWKIKEMKSVSGLNSQVVWAPDGKDVFLSSTEMGEDGEYILRLWLKDMETDITIDLTDTIKLGSDQFLITTNIDWVTL